MPPYSLLAVFAHPDDESFAMGGTLAWYAARGVRVSLVCATRGEAGKIRRPALATPTTLGAVRETELRCAAQHLGVSDVRLLGFRDSGMAGTAANTDPRALINAPGERVIRELASTIQEIRPHVIVTFGASGGYGHPDHIAISHWTLAAFDATINPRNRYGPTLAWMPRRLFYVSDPQTKIHVVLDVIAVMHAKWSAIGCHRTQLRPDDWLSPAPPAQVAEQLRWEAFTLVQPLPAANLWLPDLFAGL